MAHLLDLTSLEKALFELSDALRYLNGDFARQDKGLRRHLRAGTIQAFEFTYELAVKFITTFNAKYYSMDFRFACTQS